MATAPRASDSTDDHVGSGVHAMRLDERRARAVLLARAIETSDATGALVSDAERDQLDLRAIEQARAGGGRARDLAAALSARAEEVLRIVARRDAALASLAAIPPWRASIVWGLPLGALVLGVATDQVANPHRIDLLSLPLLALLLWNLAIYLLLALRALRPAREGPPPFATLRDLAARLVGGGVRLRQRRAAIGAQFTAWWQAAAWRLTVERATLILHLSAAAWAVGVALSLFVRGLVVEYRVGWESTFLTPEQVQLAMHVVFSPVTGLLGIAPFSLQEILALRFDSGATAAVETGRRWVVLYAGLLGLVVVLPRLLLALFTALRAGVAARRITLDLSDSYYQQLIDRLVPAEVVLRVIAHRDADRDAILRVLRAPGTPRGVAIATTPSGDALVLDDSADAPRPPAVASDAWTRWRERLFAAGDDDAPPPRGDVVLHVIGDGADLRDEDRPAARDDVPVTNLSDNAIASAPVLLLVRSTISTGDHDALLAQCVLHAKHHARIADVLPFARFARCWVQAPVLFDAIGRAVPRAKTRGFARLAQQWHASNHMRFIRSMREIAAALVAAARESENVGSAPLSLRTLISREHRDARDSAKTAAMAAVVERLRTRDQALVASLLAVHDDRADPATVAELERGLEVKVDMLSAVDARHAGLAGAASGAAMGASVDLVTGGLTLGVAALLGALVGGSAALASAAWNNRKTPAGATTIQLSDEMLDALAEASLLRYLAIIHLGGEAADATMASTVPAAAAESAPPIEASGAPDAMPSGAAPAAGPSARHAWNTEVVATMAAQRQRLHALWAAARNDASPEAPVAALHEALVELASRILRNLYPEGRIDGQ